jgi:hypothetical protein
VIYISAKRALPIWLGGSYQSLSEFPLLFYANSAGRTITGGENYTSSEKSLPALIKEKKPLWYRVLYNSFTKRISKRSMGIRRVAGLT